MFKKLELWDKVEKTDPSATKKANVRGNKITAIAPYNQIKNATEQFGPYGASWGFKNIELDYSLITHFLVTFKGQFFFPSGEFPIITSSKIFMDKNNSMIDNDFAKKIETDALTKALSKLGFNADVFLGKFDDVKYIEELKEEKAAQLNGDIVEKLQKTTSIDQLTEFKKELQAQNKYTKEVQKLFTKKAVELK